MYPPEHGEYLWSTNPDFTNQLSISQLTSKLHIQHFNNAKIIHQISSSQELSTSSQELSTSKNNMPLHKIYKKQEKLRQDSHSSYKKLPTENGEQITQYGEHMKQWGNNTFPTRKFI